MPPYPDIPKNERLAMARYILSLPDAPRGIEIRDASVRPSNPAWKLTSAHLAIANHDSVARALTGASSPLAGTIEIHETTVRDGMMSMNRVDRLVVPPGGTLRLAPGGSHLMLIDLVRDLRTGDRVPITLQFDDGSTHAVEATVSDES